MARIYKDVPHLIFAQHETQKYTCPHVSRTDKSILRELANRYAHLASEPSNANRVELWHALNGLSDCRPMVWINEVCWNEINVDGELDLRTESEFARRIESELRRKLYNGRYMPADNVFEPVIYSPMIVENTGIGIEVSEELKAAFEDNDVVSHKFHAQIEDEGDIEKIKNPHVTHFEDKTQEVADAYKDIFDGIIDVQVRGCPGFWFAPWDDIVTLTGVQETLLYISLRPEYMHRLISRITDAYLNALDQYEALGLLASNNSCDRVGSGAFGYCRELPSPKTVNARCADIWGSATPQIFGSVSPSMHEEFGIEYEKRWLNRFGLSYYGCCEPLDKKIDLLKKIGNLRKISISPWADALNAAEQIGRDYVISLKPSPAVFASESWDIDAARKDLIRKLENVKGCNVEIVLKDLSTVRYKPQRLWEWAKMATELVKKYE